MLLSGGVPYAVVIGAAALLIGLVALLLSVGALRRARAVHRRIEKLLRNSGATDIETLLHEQWQVLRGLEESQVEHGGQIEQMKEALRHSLQHMGVVRYNAFPDAGAELSFSVAMLDQERSGVVMTGLYGREETRIYAKPIERGGSRYPLSREEQDALAMALAEARG